MEPYSKIPEHITAELDKFRDGKHLIQIPGSMYTSAVCPNCAEHGGGGSLTFLIYEKVEGIARYSKGVIQRSGEYYRFIRSINGHCPVCSTEAERVDTLMVACGLKMDEYDFALSHIERMNGKEKAYKMGAHIIGQKPSPTGYYLFYGPWGVGKSGILKAITISLIRRGVMAYYCEAADLLLQLKSTFTDRQLAEQHVLDRFADVPVLLIDEVDVINDSAWAIASVRYVLNDRYENRRQKATIMATNNKPAQLWAYLKERMSDGLKIPVGGDNLRGKAENMSDHQLDALDYMQDRADLR